MALALSSPSFAEPQTFAACKKRHPLIYSAYYWSVIQEKAPGQFHFEYGTGINTQLMDVTFVSALTQINANEFEGKTPEYTLHIFLTNSEQKSKLNFTIQTRSKSSIHKDFLCE